MHVAGRARRITRAPAISCSIGGTGAKGQESQAGAVLGRSSGAPLVRPDSKKAEIRGDKEPARFVGSSSQRVNVLRK